MLILRFFRSLAFSIQNQEQYTEEHIIGNLLTILTLLMAIGSRMLEKREKWGPKALSSLHYNSARRE